MKPILSFVLVGTFFLVTIAAGPSWQISGDLSESCSCMVPCTCNFGERPFPHDFCDSLAVLGIKSGYFGNVRLDGLKVAIIGRGGNEDMIYIDESANAAQREALAAIGKYIVRADRAKVLGVRYTLITQEITSKGMRVRVGDVASFEADYIYGSNGKPIRVSSPVIFSNLPIEVTIKAKSRYLKYKDEGRYFDYTGTNANQAVFKFSCCPKLDASQ